MDEQTDLNIGIGTKEATKLKPAKVKVVSTSVEPIGSSNAKKVVCLVKHPDKDENIRISEVAYRKENRIENSGTWLNKDDDGLIRKGSALALLLEKAGVKTIGELNGKELETELDSAGYLCFKLY